MMHSIRNVARRVVVKNARFSAVATHTHGTINSAQGILETTNKLHIINTAGQAKMNVYQILDQSGKVVEGAVEPKIDEATAVKYMEAMIRIHSLDDVMYNAQRQGRISFYMQASGEEAIHIGMIFCFQ
jgi:2-oxoisovalerate dehydrogenase E1 component alpha subunit